MSSAIERLRGITAPPLLPIHLQAAILKPLVTQRTEAYATTHPPSVQMLRDANQAAFKSSEPVLISGETGTGKELVAKIILGNRPNSDYAAVNCAGVVDTLFESLLFGHIRGAFTGAQTDRPGYLVAAGAGIVFLDEVGELPLNQQAKLLRALQERVVTPVGSVTPVPIKCRFVFATNRDLRAMVREGRFREDLYYRISTLELNTYPLRDRPDDAAIIMDKICHVEGWETVDTPVPHAVIQSRGNVRALRKWIVRYLTFGYTDWTE